MKTIRGSIFHFDATEVRREMMKRRSGSFQPWEDPFLSQGKEKLPLAEPILPAAPAVLTTEPQSQDNLPTREELKAYIIHFVMEQTGYPEEMITLDADLEGDLGIDSIKKAQLMGELNEMFCFADLASGEVAELTLDDFPTLGHILEYMSRKMVKDSPTIPVSAPSGEPFSPVVATESSENELPTREELKAYIVNFVMEQTGYPEEMITLDADLEGDLGIDSIKKAQLMGELNEMFCFVDLASGEETELTLDDFPTLGHILDYMTRKRG